MSARYECRISVYIRDNQSCSGGLQIERTIHVPSYTLEQLGDLITKLVNTIKTAEQKK